MGEMYLGQGSRFVGHVKNGDVRMFLLGALCHFVAAGVKILQRHWHTILADQNTKRKSRGLLKDGCRQKEQPGRIRCSFYFSLPEAQHFLGVSYEL